MPPHSRKVVSDIRYNPPFTFPSSEQVPLYVGGKCDEVGPNFGRLFRTIYM